MNIEDEYPSGEYKFMQEEYERKKQARKELLAKKDREKKAHNVAHNNIKSEPKNIPLPQGIYLTPIKTEWKLASYSVKYLTDGMTPDSVFYGLHNGLVDDIISIDEALKYSTQFTSVDFLNKVKEKVVQRFRENNFSTYCSKIIITEALQHIHAKYPSHFPNRQADIIIVIEISDSFSEKTHLFSNLEKQLTDFFHPRYEQSEMEKYYILGLPGFKKDKNKNLYIDYGTIDYIIVNNNFLNGDNINLSVYQIKRNQ